LIRQGNPNAKIYMLQVCHKEKGDFKPSKEAVLKAIEWVIENDIDIVNMSLVADYDRDIEKSIDKAATSHGVLFIAAAGNRSIASRFAADSDGFIRRSSEAVKPAFPSSNKNVISVGAVDYSGRITSYSDKFCDIYEDGKILGQEGTSFSCARVTSQAARILAYRTDASRDLVLSQLK